SRPPRGRRASSARTASTTAACTPCRRPASHPTRSPTAPPPGRPPTPPSRRAAPPNPPPARPWSSEDPRVGTSLRTLALQESFQIVSDHLGVVGFGVVGRAADVRGEDDVRHRAQRVIDRQGLTFEVVEAGAAELAVAQRVDQRVEVVQGG